MKSDRTALPRTRYRFYQNGLSLSFTYHKDRWIIWIILTAWIFRLNLFNTGRIVNITQHLNRRFYWCISLFFFLFRNIVWCVCCFIFTSKSMFICNAIILMVFKIKRVTNCVCLCVKLMKTPGYGHVIIISMHCIRFVWEELKMQTEVKLNHLYDLTPATLWSSLSFFCYVPFHIQRKV